MLARRLALGAAGLLLLVILLQDWTRESSIPGASPGSRGPVRPDDSAAELLTGSDPQQASGAGVSTTATERSVVPGDVASRQLVVLLRDQLDRKVDEYPVYVHFELGERGEHDDLYLYRVSDSSGRVVFEAEELARLAAQQPGVDAWVEFANRLPQPVGASFNLLDLPVEPVVLRADLGLATVEVLDADGTPRQDRGSLVVSPEDLSYFSKAGPSGFRVWIPLRCTYELKASRFGVTRPVTESFPPMTVAEPERDHQLRLSGRYPAVYGRLLLPSGEPVADRQRFVLYSMAEDHYLTQDSWTGHDGRIRVPLSSERLPRGEVVRLRIKTSSGVRRYDLTVELQVPIPIDDIDIEVGDLRLEDRPILVAGMVVDSKGEPLSKVSVRPESRSPGGSWQGIPIEEYLSTYYLASTKTNTEGVFELFGKGESGKEYRIKTYRYEDGGPYLVTPRMPYFVPGTEDLRIQLVEAAWVEAGIVSSDSSTLKAVRGEVFSVPHADRLAEPVRMAASPDVNGRLRIGPLPPGAGKLELRSTFRTAPTLIVDDLRLESGKTLYVGELDLIEAGVLIQVRILNAGAEDLIQIRYRISGQLDFPFRKSVFGSAAFELWVAEPPVDLWVSGDGYRPEFYSNIGEDIEIQLEAAPRATIRWHGLERLAESVRSRRYSVKLHLQFEFKGPRPLAPIPEGAAIDPFLSFYLRNGGGRPARNLPRESRVSFPHPGNFKASLTLKESSSHEQAFDPYDGQLDLGPFEVLAGDDQVIDILLPPRPVAANGKGD